MEIIEFTLIYHDVNSLFLTNLLKTSGLTDIQGFLTKSAQISAAEWDILEEENWNTADISKN